MSNMVLGSYTFAANPSNMPAINKVLDIAYTKTYSSVATFSWGTSYVGLELTLKWEHMRNTQWDSLDAIYQADADVVFDPQDGESKTFNVHVVSFNGDHYLDVTDRENVVMVLLFRSEVVA